MPKAKMIKIYTPYRKGGPWNWGAQLTQEINAAKNDLKADHIHDLSRLLISFLYPSGQIIHSVNPILFTQKPYILTIHGDYRLESSNPLSRLYPRAIELADVVTVPSEYLKNKLALPVARVIPNALDPTVFKLATPNQSQSPDSSNRPIEILTVSKFFFKDKAEGVVKIARILSRFQDRVKRSINYRVLGAGQYLEVVKKQTAHLSVKPEFVGFTNPKPYLAQADIFAYYSRHDNLPYAVMEAMASSLPVITNPVGAIPEIISHKKTGLLAENEKDYLAALEFTLDQPKKTAEIGQAAAKVIQDKYSWQAVTQQWLELYQEVLAK